VEELNGKEKLMSETETGLPPGLPLGKVYTSRGRTIPDGECTLLTDLTWTTMGIHVDEPYARTSRFGELVLAAPVMVPIVSGLWVMGEHNRHLREKYGVRVSTALGCEARYRSPFKFGDTIWVEHQLAEVRPSKSNPGMGVATMVDRAYNQRGETVTEMKRFQLVQPMEKA
jgi:acyl dehydratase